MGAKPCAPVCLSASPSWAPRGTRDREGQTQGEREGERKGGRERERDTEGERKRSQGAGVKNVLQRKQSSETSPLFALFSTDPHGIEEHSTNVKYAIRLQNKFTCRLKKKEVQLVI